MGIAGLERSFHAVITEQTPDQRVAWTTRTGPEQSGVVTFHRLDDDQTRVTLEMTFDSEGIVEQVADKTGLVNMRTKGDLERFKEFIGFKEFIESRGTETGAWRGEIEGPQ